MKRFGLYILVIVALMIFTNNKIDRSKYFYIYQTENVDSVLIRILSTTIDSCFGFHVIHSNTIHFEDELLSKSKRSYDGQKIISKYDNNQNLMVITTETLSCENNGTEMLLSGWAEKSGNMSVISTYRIDSGVPFNLLISRVKKLVLHEVAHNLGLIHCDNRQCIMNMDSKLDDQRSWFCDNCKMKLPEK